jgi:hypothetical protein
MNKRGPRPVVFVCIGIGENANTFVSKVIQAVSPDEAGTLFLEQTNLKAKTIHGPFRPKRAQVIENTRTLKFSDKKQEKAIYNDWEVNVLFLKEPENHAYLLFVRRVDGKKQPSPKGTIIVPVADLRFNKNE